MRKIITILMSLMIMVSNISLINATELQEGKLYRSNGKLLYEGQLLNGIRQGKGIEYSLVNNEPQVFYVGDFKNNYMDGFGTQYIVDKVINYLGFFKQGQPHGFGVQRGCDKLEAIGDFVKVASVFSSDGVSVTYQGGVFKEETYYGYGCKLMLLTKERNQVKTPIATYITNVPSMAYGSYIGEDIELEKMISIIKQHTEPFQNTYKILDELTYIGDKNSDGLRHGYGKLYNDYGQLIYAGSWENGKMDGFGATFYDNRLSYLGEFEQGLATGFGIVYSVVSNSPIAKMKLVERDIDHIIYRPDNIKYLTWETEMLAIEEKVHELYPFVLENNDINTVFTTEDLEEDKLKSLVHTYKQIVNRIVNRYEHESQLKKNKKRITV